MEKIPELFAFFAVAFTPFPVDLLAVGFHAYLETVSEGFRLTARIYARNNRNKTADWRRQAQVRLRDSLADQLYSAVH